jgi:hypothetical protein
VCVGRGRVCSFFDRDFTALEGHSRPVCWRWWESVTLSRQRSPLPAIAKRALLSTACAHEGDAGRYRERRAVFTPASAAALRSSQRRNTRARVLLGP